MIYVIIPVIDGKPDLDWSEPPIESFQLLDTERYCMFSDNVVTRPNWQQITEEQYNQVKPVMSLPEPAPTLEDKINYLYYKSTGVIL